MLINEILTITTEGANDPNIFKAVFMAGAPGSGKTTIASKLFGGSGLKSLNVDKFWQLYSKQQKEPDYDKFWNRYSIQNKRYMNERLGLLIDGTAKNPQKMQDVKKHLESLGYDTVMIFVNTDLETATRRSQKRAASPGPDQGRELDPSFIKDAWTRTQQALGSYQSMFGKNFYIVDNSNENDPESFEYVDGQVRKWLASPPSNHIAKKWLADQSAQKSTNLDTADTTLGENSGYIPSAN